MGFELELDHDRGVPVYRQIYEAVVQSLASGGLTASERLPTIHDLAARLGINPNTVVRAYKELERDGHIVSKRGRGTFASDTPARLPPGRQERILRDIYDRAVLDAAKHGVSPRQLLRFFRKAVQDDR